MFAVTDGFPRDFSIVSVFKTKKDLGGYLLTVYNENSREVMGLEIGEQFTFLYEDTEGRPGHGASPKFDFRLNDGE